MRDDISDLTDELDPTGSSTVAALIAIGHHYGLQIDGEQLTRAHRFEGVEPTTAFLRQMASGAGLVAKPIIIKRGELSKLARVVPAILRLADGRSLLLDHVLSKDGLSIATLRDPAAPLLPPSEIDETRLFESWNGEIILVKRYWRTIDDEKPFGLFWLYGQMAREAALFRDIGLGSLLMSILIIAPAFMVMIVLDRVLTNHSFSTLSVVAAAIIVIIGADTFAAFLRRHLIETATSRIDGRLNLYVFDKLLNLPLSFFEHLPTGIINARIAEVWRIRQFMTGQLFTTILDGLTLCVIVPVLFALNWILATLVLVLALGIVAVYAAFLPALRKRHQAVVHAEQNLGAHQVETIYGIRTIKSLGLEGLKRQQRDIRVAKVLEARLALGRLVNYPQTLVNPLQLAIYSGSMLVGAVMILTDPQGGPAGVLIAFSMIAGRVTGPLVQFAGLLNTLEDVRSAISLVGSVMNQPAEQGRSGSGLKLPIRGSIQFQDVCFRYAADAPAALDHVSFTIPQGTIFGVMGRSGSGKTTVTRLLQGLHRNYEGIMKIDGMDLREIDLDHLRSKIGIVAQENFLFSGTIRENIAAGRPNASFDAIVKAAQMAGAEEFIERLPRGYETYIEENAVNLSGGQRQRLAIARTLLMDPPVLMLDEATSALDAESEAIVSANLLRIAQDRTVIIISHRLSSLVSADSILVLERGRVNDIGRHGELLSRCDIYKNLWYQQNRHLRQDSDGYAVFGVPQRN